MDRGGLKLDMLMEEELGNGNVEWDELRSGDEGR